jgi:hypothetical protein
MQDIEQLIERAEIALCYADRDEVMAALIASGVEAEVAYLATAAALVPSGVE